MSRSYKKAPICKDNGIGKNAKRLANKVVRRAKIENLKTGKSNSYRKQSNSYNIHDYVSYWSREEAIKNYEEDKCGRWQSMFPTLEEFLNYWAKCCQRK